jgi:hypothetical protein
MELEGGSAPTQDEQEQKRTHNGNDYGADATEAIGEESEHREYRHWSGMWLGFSRSCPISLRPPNHKYQAVYIRQMVQSASDTKDGDLINSVVIEKATSDEPDNAPDGADGKTRNDLVIAGDRKSVQLSSERDETKNGRVYSVTLRVADSAGNVTRAEFKVNVPLNQSGDPAVEDMPQP